MKRHFARFPAAVLFVAGALLAGCSSGPQDNTPLPQGAWPEPPENRAGSRDSDLPYAKPAPGKPGYVISPYHAGYVDVRGFTRGTQVRCPYTGRLFLVP